MLAGEEEEVPAEGRGRVYSNGESGKGETVGLARSLYGILTLSSTTERFHVQRDLMERNVGSEEEVGKRDHVDVATFAGRDKEGHTWETA